MSLERLKTDLERIYKTFTDWNIPLPPKVDQARDFYGALNPGFFAEVKAYQLALKYVQPVPIKSGAKTNITFATFQQRNCNFITSTSKSARLTERSAGRAATNDTDDNQEEPRGARGRGTHGNHKDKRTSDKGRRADIISREESGGAAKQEEADYDSDYFESTPDPCMNCNQHLIPDQKDDRALWRWKQRCPNAKKIIKNYLEYNRRVDKMKLSEPENLAARSCRHCTRYHESACSPRRSWNRLLKTGWHYYDIP